MKKLRLEVEALEIESFDTSLVADERRTVVAYETSEADGCTEGDSASCTCPIQTDDCNGSAGCAPATWTQDQRHSYCCHTWALDSRCADSWMSYCVC